MARCPDCNSSGDIFGLYGDGVCSHCHGDGKSLLSGLNEAVMGVSLECNYCDGSRICQTCGGSGKVDDDEKAEYSSCEKSASKGSSDESPSSFELRDDSDSDFQSSDDDDSDSSYDSGSYLGSYSGSYSSGDNICSPTKSSGVSSNSFDGNKKHEGHKADHRPLVLKKTTGRIIEVNYSEDYYVYSGNYLHLL